MPSPLPDRIESAFESAESDYSSTTIQSYRAAWRDLLEWWSGAADANAWVLKFEEEGVPLLSFEDLAEYFEDRQEMAWSTLTGRRQAIRLVYDHYDALDPFEQSSVSKAWAEVRRQKQEERKSSDPTGDDYGPAEVIENGLDLLEAHFAGRHGREDMSEEELLRRDMQYLPQEVSSAEGLDPDQQDLIPEPAYDRKTARNRALLLLVATTSATRSEITEIQVDDVHRRDKDVFLQSEAKRTKGAPLQIGFRDDEGNLKSVLHLRREPELRFCPPRAVASWIVRGGLEGGALFRSLTPQGKLTGSGIQPQAINHVIRRRAKDLEGLDASDWTTRRLRSR